MLSDSSNTLFALTLIGHNNNMLAMELSGPVFGGQRFGRSLLQLVPAEGGHCLLFKDCDCGVAQIAKLSVGATHCDKERLHY